MTSLADAAVLLLMLKDWLPGSVPPALLSLHQHLENGAVNNLRTTDIGMGLQLCLQYIRPTANMTGRQNVA